MNYKNPDTLIHRFCTTIKNIVDATIRPLHKQKGGALIESQSLKIVSSAIENQQLLEK